MIREYEFFHGAVLVSLLHSYSTKITSGTYLGFSNSAYVVNDRVGLYIKYSSKRMSPWRFSFAKEHQDEIQKLRDELSDVYVVFVCNDDGFASLSFSELRQILDAVHKDVEWVSISRNPREMYSVKGSDGALAFKVGVSDLWKKLAELIVP